MTMEPNEPPSPNQADADRQSYAFVLKLSDQPGSMELVAATFAHRGISLDASLGNDGTLDPEGRATVVVTFSASAAKKENVRRALASLARVRSLTEYPLDSPHLRKTVVFRLAGDPADVGPLPAGLRLEKLATEENESIFLVVDTPAMVDGFLARLRETGRLRDVAAAVIGL